MATGGDGPLLTDLSLARRIERAEATANAAFVEARAALEPGMGATWIDVAGVYAMFDGPTSPVTQTFGLGLFEPVGDAELDAIESFFHERGAPVAHEVCPLIPPDVLGRLNARGYQPIEFSSVMVQPLAAEPHVSATAVEVRHVGPEEVGLWARVAGQGWSSESEEAAAFVEGIGAVIGRARGSRPFLAWLDDRPIAAASLYLHGDIAILAGASTIPDGRRQGAQLALLNARLRFASQHGARIAMMVALPGSGSQRNAERRGFRTVYTRTKFLRRSDA